MFMGIVFYFQMTWVKIFVSFLKIVDSSIGLVIRYTKNMKNKLANKFFDNKILKVKNVMKRMFGKELLLLQNLPIVKRYTIFV